MHDREWFARHQRRWVHQPQRSSRFVVWIRDLRRLRDCRPAGDDTGRGGCSQPQKVQARREARLLFLRPAPPTQASLAGFFGHKKTPSICLGLSGVGGPKRIRTAVAAFAELSLATRPSDPFQSGREPPWACEYTKVGSLRFHFCGDKFRKDAYNAGDGGGGMG